MTDPNAYLNGTIHPDQTSVYDLLATLQAEADTEAEIRAEYAQVEAAYDEWVTQAEKDAEEDYLATCGGYVDALADEVTWDDPEG